VDTDEQQAGTPRESICSPGVLTTVDTEEQPAGIPRESNWVNTAAYNIIRWNRAEQLSRLWLV
jgi:hypothetical protein